MKRYSDNDTARVIESATAIDIGWYRADEVDTRIQELEEALRECCRMFEWCDARYWQLVGRDIPPCIKNKNKIVQ